MGLDLRAHRAVRRGTDGPEPRWSIDGRDGRLAHEGDVRLGDAGIPAPDASVDRLRWSAHQLTGSERLAWLRECRRVLRPGGAVVIEPGTPSAEDLDRAAAVVGLGRPVEQADGSITLELDRPPPLRRPPLVSVLVAAHRPAHLDEALRSARDQTWTNLEIVVGIDGGTDLRQVVERHAALDDRVVMVGPPPQPGGRENYLHVLGHATGPYLKFLNDDDLLAPDAVERMARCLMGLPRVTLVTSHRRMIDADGTPLPDTHATRRRSDVDIAIPGPTAARDLVVNRVNWVGEPTTTMFRSADLRGGFPFAVERRPAITNGDFALWLQLLGRGDLVYLADSLSTFRRHDEQRSQEASFRERADEGMRRICEEGEAIGLHHAIGAERPPNLLELARS